MKSLLFFITPLSSLALFAQDFSSPEETFKTLLVAIETMDIELYERCWDPEMLEKEGMYSRLKDNPKLWEELQNGFKGPQEIDAEDFIDREDGSYYKAQIIAPEADGGGIGTLMMKEIDGLWKMHRW